MNKCAKCNENESNMNNKHGNNEYYGHDFKLWFCNYCAGDKDAFIDDNIDKLRDKLVLLFVQPERIKREDSRSKDKE